MNRNTVSWLLTVAALGAAFVVACSGCQPQPQPAPIPEPVPVVVVDAGPPLDASRLDICAKACRNLRAHGCPDGQPTPAGTPCETVCREDRAQSEARLSTRYLECLASLTSCSAEARCAR